MPKLSDADIQLIKDRASDEGFKAGVERGKCLGKDEMRTDLLKAMGLSEGHLVGPHSYGSYIRKE